MSDRTDPVVVSLNCEARPSRETVEIDRSDQVIADLRTLLTDPNHASAPSPADPRKPYLRAVRKDGAR